MKKLAEEEGDEDLMDEEDDEGLADPFLPSHQSTSKWLCTTQEDPSRRLIW